LTIEGKKFFAVVRHDVNFPEDLSFSFLKGSKSQKDCQGNERKAKHGGERYERGGNLVEQFTWGHSFEGHHDESAECASRHERGEGLYT